MDTGMYKAFLFLLTAKLKNRKHLTFLSKNYLICIREK